MLILSFLQILLSLDSLLEFASLHHICKINIASWLLSAINISPSKSAGVDNNPSCNLNTGMLNILYSISSFLSYDKLSSPYKALVFSVSSNFELKTFSQAFQYQCWCEAMAAEIKALESNNTWTLTSLLDGK